VEILWTIGEKAVEEATAKIFFRTISSRNLSAAAVDVLSSGASLERRPPTHTI
jgi:hypothetical protein